VELKAKQSELTGGCVYYRECLEHRLDAVYLQKVSAVFSGQLRRQRWPSVVKSTQIGLLGAEISHLVADCRPKSGRDFFDVIWAAKHSLNISRKPAFVNDATSVKSAAQDSAPLLP